MSKLLESLAAIANVDKKLQAQVLKVSVALSLKAAPRTLHNSKVGGCAGTCQRHYENWWLGKG